MTKKIGIDARFFTEKATGVGRHTFELVKHLAKLDTKNQYTLFFKPEIAEKYTPPAKNFSVESTTAAHYSLAEQTSFLKQINHHRFDLMVFPQFNVPIFYRGKFVVTIHDLTLHFFPGKKKNDFLSRLAYKKIIKNAVTRAEHCFAVSANTKDDMVKILKVPGEKITIALNGVSTNFQPINETEKEKFQQQYDLPEKYFLYTGVSRSHKNILGLIRSYHYFLKNHQDTEIQLVLAGPKDPMYMPEVEHLIKKLKLQEKVRHLGLFPEKDFAKLMGSAHAFIFPSFYEGFGIPPLEAMSCGIPTITSNASSLPEACGEATIYFDPYDTNEMAEVMEKVAYDDNLRENLIAKGLERPNQFSWEAMAKKMFREYEKILQNA